jgi:hypothetical protein
VRVTVDYTIAIMAFAKAARAKGNGLLWQIGEIAYLTPVSYGRDRPWPWDIRPTPTSSTSSRSKSA